MSARAVSAGALLLLPTLSPALPCPDPAGRYGTEVFREVKETPDLVFAEARNPLRNGRLEVLRLDVYEPAGDPCARRPLVLFLHGGWMQTGDRRGEAGSCRQFARRGAVCASLEYRLGRVGEFSARNFATPAFMAGQDARAAARFFRSRAAAWRIDTGAVFVGGCSAGAYASLHAAYLDRPEEIPPWVDAAVREDGFEGTGGSAPAATRFQGVLALSGGLFDTAWLDRGDAPVVTVQCDGDGIVPAGADSLKDPNTGRKFIPSFGSTVVDARARAVGVPSLIRTFRGGCHCPHPVGPTGVDSTLDFFGKSLRTLLGTPAGVRRGDAWGAGGPRLAVALRPGDLAALARAGRLRDLRGRTVMPGLPWEAGLRPGLYRIAPRRAEP